MTHPIPRQSPFGRALRNVGWLLTGKGVGAVLSLVYLGLATRSLGIERFGQFMLILSTAQTVAAFVGFESWQIVVRYGADPLARGDRHRLGSLVGFCAVLDLVAGAVGCVIAVVAIAVLRTRFGWSPALAREAMVFAAVLLLSVRSTAVGILRLHDRFAAGAAADAITPVVRFAGALVALAVGASVTGFLVAWAAAEVLTALGYWLVARRVASPGTWHWQAWRSAPAACPGIRHFALVSNINSTLANGSRQAMVVTVGIVAGPAAAGAYRLAFQLSQALARLSDMFARAMLPEFARAHAVDAASLKGLLRQSTRLSIAAGLFICAITPLVGRPVLSLVGGAPYAAAFPLLVLLSLAAAVELMGVGFEPMLLGTGRAGDAFRARRISVGVLVVAAAVLMPRYGPIGAATATLLAALAALALLWRLGWRALVPRQPPAGR